jgi:hypothetical protein
MVTATPNTTSPSQERPMHARIAVMSFPNDPDLPPRKVVVYEIHKTRP